MKPFVYPCFFRQLLRKSDSRQKRPDSRQKGDTIWSNITSVCETFKN